MARTQTDLTAKITKNTEYNSKNTNTDFIAWGSTQNSQWMEQKVDKCQATRQSSKTVKRTQSIGLGANQARNKTRKEAEVRH